MISEAIPPIPVSNGFGWTSTIPNQMTCRWVQSLYGLPGAKTIDIGAGFGVGTIPALEAGAHVIANDIAESQLTHIASVAEQKGLHARLELLCAALPELPPTSDLDFIHAANVLHFLTGTEMIQSVQWMFNSLRRGGHAYVQTLSPYAGHFKSFLAEYELRMRSGVAWPGEMNNAKSYVERALRDMTPQFMHVLDAPALIMIFRNAGFEIAYCDYYTRPGLPAICRLDGRENLGLVAMKI